MSNTPFTIGYLKEMHPVIFNYLTDKHPGYDLTDSNNLANVYNYCAMMAAEGDDTEVLDYTFRTGHCTDIEIIDLASDYGNFKIAEYLIQKSFYSDVLVTYISKHDDDLMAYLQHMLGHLTSLQQVHQKNTQKEN